MRDQQEAAFAGEIAAHYPAALQIQMVGGLVQQKEGPLTEKKGGQEHLDLLAAGEGGVGAEQDPGIHLQRVQLLVYTPEFQSGLLLLQNGQGVPLRRGHRGGEAVKGYRHGNRAVVFVLPLEQPQQGGLAPAVAPHQTQPPVGIQLQAQVLKDIVVAAGISKGQIPDIDQSHDRSPQIQNMGAEGFAFRAHVPKNGYHKGKCTA